MNKIIIPLGNGFNFVAERNSDSEFNKEIFIGIEKESGAYWQDLCIVRPTYTIKNDDVTFSSDEFEVLVYGDNKNEDWTHSFVVPLNEEDE